ncbi:hypothetical protein sos41_21820 [Alphaproteobacteria bacterium SO-S41]|nr:hypothetical protein sos41_21820 [Alphaproteobacteria bacterium SO-S41]
MRVFPAVLVALSLAVPAGAQVIAAPGPGRVVEGFMSHRATYDLRLKKARWAANVAALNGRLVSEFDDVCAGFTFNQRLVTDYIDAEGKTTSSNFWISTYESADGSSYRFSLNNFVDGVSTEKTQGAATRGSDGAGQVAFTLPDGKNVTLPAGITFPTEFMGRLVSSARAGKHAASTKMFEGDAEGKVYDAFAAIGTERKASEADLAVPGGAALKDLKAWPVTVSYYAPGKNDDLPEYETSFTLFENGVTSGVTLDYGDFTLFGTLRKIEPLQVPKC